MPTALSAAPPAHAGPHPGYLGLERGLQDLPREHGREPLRVEGELPAELSGTAYFCGAFLLSRFGREVEHWFDGDGGVASVTFDGGRAHGAARVLRTRAYVEERRAGRPLYSGLASVPAWRRRLAMRNVANTNVLGWRGRLFALWEGGLPTELDPETLETAGETDLGGLLRGAVTAHPHRVEARRATYLFALSYGLRNGVTLYELPDEGPPRRLPVEVPFARVPSLHDFAVTRRHAVFLAPPLHVRMLRYVAGLGTMLDNWSWMPREGTEIVLVELDRPHRVTRFRAPPSFDIHLANAFEDGDGRVVVDCIRHDAADIFVGRFPLHGPGGFFRRALPRYRAVRATIDPRRLTAHAEPLWSVPCEFPAIDERRAGGRHRNLYVVVQAPEGAREHMPPSFDVGRIDTETGRVAVATMPAGSYASQPLFVPRRGGERDDDGWLVTLVYDSERHASHAAVLDAAAPDRGVLARAWFDHHVPPPFHGTWMEP